MPLIWPPTLPPAPLVEGFEETAPSITIRSSVDAGPAKVRRRFTAAPSDVTCQYTVDRTLMLVLDDFYFNLAAGGAIPFEWEHPMRREAVMVRFREAPRYRPEEPEIWTATLSLEVLPPGMAVRAETLHALQRARTFPPTLTPPAPPPPAIEAPAPAERPA